MYSMEQLITVLTTEKACELRFCAGKPPIVALEKYEYPLQGPPITTDEVAQLLRSVANSRQIRELRQRGAVQFVFTVRDRMPVLVRAQMEDMNIAFNI
jgi:Tfp pilus assembly pilus retraction ATPase PilT